MRTDAATRGREVREGGAEADRHNGLPPPALLLVPLPEHRTSQNKDHISQDPLQLGVARLPSCSQHDVNKGNMAIS